MRLPRLGFTIVLSTAALAQFPPIQPPAEKAGSELIYVDVAATDASGHPVPGLTAADFTLSQDDKARSIVKFMGDRATRERAVVLVVDDLGLSRPGVDRVRAALQKFLAEQITSSDRAAIVRTSGGSVDLLRLSSDKRELAGQLERIDSHPLADPSGTQPATFLPGTLQGLRTVMEGLRGTPGRKAVVLFSERLNMTARLTPAANTAIESIATRCTELAGITDAVLYAIDVQPGNSTESAGRSLVRIETGILGIVSDTGGLVLDGGSDMQAALDRTLKDHGSSYRLGFQSEDRYQDFTTGTDAYRKIAVHTARAGVSLRARKVVYGPPSYAPYKSTGLDVMPVFFYAPGSGTYVNLLIHLDGKSLTSVRDLKGRYSVLLDLEVVVFDSEGQAGTPISQTLVAQFSEEGIRAAIGHGMVYPFRIAVRGTGLHRVQVRMNDDAGGGFGRTSEVFTVPNVAAGTMVMTGIILSPERDNPAPDQTIQEGPAVRRYRAGASFRYGYDLYNLTRDATKRSSAETRMNLYRLGRPVSIGQPRPVSFDGAGDVEKRSVSGVIKLPQTLAPGRYVLSISTIDKLAPQPHEVIEYTDFWVLPPASQF